MNPNRYNLNNILFTFSLLIFQEDKMVLYLLKWMQIKLWSRKAQHSGCWRGQINLFLAAHLEEKSDQAVHRRCSWRLQQYYSHSSSPAQVDHLAARGDYSARKGQCRGYCQSSRTRFVRTDPSKRRRKFGCGCEANWCRHQSVSTKAYLKMYSGTTLIFIWNLY